MKFQLAGGGGVVVQEDGDLGNGKIVKKPLCMRCGALSEEVRK